MSDTEQDRPLDAVLRARLHLPAGSNFRLKIISRALVMIDSISRTLSGRPLFAFKESENLLRQLNGLAGTEITTAILEMNGGTEIVAHGLEHVPASGAVIIASTHPTGMLDFVAHAGALYDRRPDLKVVANQEVESFLGENFIVPVKIDKSNRAQSANLVYKGMQQHLEQGGALLIFGSGRVPSQINGLLVEPKWRIGTSRISLACQVPVIPAAIDAKNSAYYYSIRKLGQFLTGGNEHFGAMLGSLRYAAELLEKLGGRIETYYGRPLSPGTPPKSLQEAAEGLVPGLYASS